MDEHQIGIEALWMEERIRISVGWVIRGMIFEIGVKILGWKMMLGRKMEMDLFYPTGFFDHQAGCGISNIDGTN
jgi:hypothetical protein